jgi:DnaJ-class molecular chaperone
MSDKRYNAHLNKFIELSESEIFCKKCHGKGRNYKNKLFFRNKNKSSLCCDVCLGDGKIDWVEEIVGKTVARGKK